MKTAIEKIYSGDTDHQNFEMTEEWKRLASKGLKIYEEFYASLTEKQKKQFDEIYHNESGQEAEVALQCYEEGFKLGLKLGAEVFGEREA